jgi:hypothetical protein
MRLPKAGLPRQERDADSPPLNPAQQFQAEPLVHLGKIHLWKIRHQQWEPSVPIFLLQTWGVRVAFILGASPRNGKGSSGKPLGEIDAREASF